jgi:predicted DCC family thiol-disulfide oxidoreductase YuxK
MEHYAGICATTRPELRFIDSTQGPNDFTRCGLRQEHLERRVYIRIANGQIVSGMPAIVALWAQMPGYQWAGRLFNLPVIRQATELLYDHLISPSLALWARSRARQRRLHPGGA